MTKFKRSILLSTDAYQGYRYSFVKEGNRTDGVCTGVVMEEEGVQYHEWKSSNLPKTAFLYCKCGFSGDVEPVRERYTLTFEMSPLKRHADHPINRMYSRYCREEKKVVYYDAKKKVVHAKPLYRCPACLSKPDGVLTTSIPSSKAFIEFAEIWDNRTKEVPRNSLTFGWGTTYYLSGKANVGKTDKKIAIKSTRMRITVNLDTGMTYFVKIGKNEKPYNITFGKAYQPWMKKELKALSGSNKAMTLLKQFLRTCLKERGVSYVEMDQILLEERAEKLGDLVESGDIFKTLPFIRYPKLECGPWMDWRNPPDRIKRKLRKAGHTRTDLVEVLTGHRGKAVRKAIEPSSHLFAAMVLGPLLKDSNNLQKFFEWKGEKYRPLNHWFQVLETIDYPLFKKGFRLIRKCYQDEAQFVNTLIRFAKKLGGGLNPEEEPFPMSNIFGTIADIQRQYEVIKIKKPAYQISYKGDIRQLHDDLSRDYRRMQHENKCIPYETEEKERYERTVDEYTFVLAKDTHQLMDVGDEMNICVGSYHESAFLKKTTIVLAYNVSGELRLCLEVKPQLDGTRRLTQAKLKRNQLPERDEALVVKKWCELCRIDAEGVYDLREIEKKKEQSEVEELLFEF